MVFYSKRIIIVRRTDLSEFFSLIFVGKMCVFVSRQTKIVTFHRKNDYHPKRVVEFPRERDTFRNKIMEIVEDLNEKSYNNNGKPWKSSRILRVNPFFHFSFFFHHFSPFFVLFSFFTFSFVLIFSFFFFFTFFLIFLIFSFFHFLSCSFIFIHVLSFSFMFFHVLPFMFFHCPSFSFIFTHCHFLCLCWVLKI